MKFNKRIISFARCNHIFHFLLAKSLRTKFSRTLSYVYICYEKIVSEIPCELPKPHSPIEKHQSLLHAIGGDFYVKKIGQKIPPLKKRRLSKKAQAKEDKIKRKLHIGMIGNFRYTGINLSG